MKSKIVITIARDYGSGGKTVGQMLAKELNISRERTPTCTPESTLK